MNDNDIRDFIAGSCILKDGPFTDPNQVRDYLEEEDGLDDEDISDIVDYIQRNSDEYGECFDF